MIGHLGPRVSALLDGQLSKAEADEAWAHVYACHACRDLVEREGWVKTRLAGLCDGAGSASSDLKGSLLSLTPGERFLAETRHHPGGLRRGVGVAVLGGGALGAAVVGVLALGIGGSSSPVDRRPPVSRIETPVVSDVERRVPEDVVTVRASDSGNGTAGGAPAAAVTVVPEWATGLLP